jgi:hypothetical protein
VTEDAPKFIKSGDAAIVTLIPDSQKAALYVYFLFYFKVDRRTGKSTEDAPKFIKSGDAAIVTLIPIKPLFLNIFTLFLG